MSVTPESVGALLNSQDFGDRLRALTQLRQLEPTTAYSLILPAIADAHPRVRYAAVSLMARLGQQNLVQASSLLRNCLRDSDMDVQAAAADSIGALKLKDAFEDLHQLYQNSSEWVVQFSIIAVLGELGDDRAFAILEDALNSSNELMQTAAIGSLGELGDVRAVALLTPFIANPDWQIRYRLAQALGRLGGAEAMSALKLLTQDAVDQVAQEATINLKG
jgi:HEAT repeat protein